MLSLTAQAMSFRSNEPVEICVNIDCATPAKKASEARACSLLAYGFHQVYTWLRRIETAFSDVISTSPAWIGPVASRIRPSAMGSIDTTPSI